MKNIMTIYRSLMKRLHSFTKNMFGWVIVRFKEGWVNAQMCNCPGGESVGRGMVAY